MILYVVFNFDHELLMGFSIPDLTEISIPSFSISFVTGRNTRISEGDKFLTLNQGSFLWRGVIAKVETEPPPAEEKGKYTHTFTLELEEALVQDNELSDYAYSLIRVNKHFKEPVKHFKRVYAILQKEDYETIVQADYFLERTVLGSLLNALPFDTRMMFVQEAIARLGNAFVVGGEYLEGVKLLRRFVERNILEPGRYLVASRDILQDQFPEIPLEEIGFKEDSGESFVPQRKPTFYLNDQARKFDRLFENAGFWDEIEQEFPKAKPSGKRKIHQQPWPIQFEKL